MPIYAQKLPRNTPRLRAAFASLVKRGPIKECWVFGGSTNVEAYGRFYTNGNEYYAHRIAYLIAFGPPGKKHVLHTCDNPPCCNPHHLFLGVQADNNNDKVSKRRHRYAERHHNHKLTSREVRQIRVAYRCGVNSRVLRERYHVGGHTLYCALHGITWKYAGGPIEKNKPQHGDTHSQTKITDRQVVVIRRAKKRKVKAKILAARYGVALDTIYHIWAGLSR